jgi:futalosine hydrolase
MPQVLLLTATALEQDALVRSLEEPVAHRVAGRVWHQGRLGAVAVWLAETGIGAVNAAHTLTCGLQSRRPDLVLQVGVGGAYSQSQLALGDLAVASSEAYGDLGVRAPGGWQPAEVIGIPVLQLGEDTYFNAFPLDPGLVASAHRVLERAAWPEVRPTVSTGPFVTVQECSGTTALGQERAGRFGAICENMEGAAAAHLCRLYGVPFLEVRSVSNQVEDRRREVWNLPLASQRAQQAALRLLAELGL